MLRTLIAVATFAAGAALPGIALGQECVDLAAIEARVAGDGAFIAHDFRGDDALAWLAAYNAEPPPSDITGDQVVVLEHPRRATAYVYVLSDGCVIGSGEFTRMFLYQLNRAVLGPVGTES